MHPPRTGIDESQRLDFYSPYGCSKGTADQYVLDYAHTFGLPAVVFRMSCIYGPRQFGTEDQGWVAHFLIRALEREPDHALRRRTAGARHPFRGRPRGGPAARPRAGVRVQRRRPSIIGGGPEHTTSLLELMDLIAEIDGQRPEIEWGDWRPGDQRYYVSDTSKFSRATGWRARTSIEDGVRQLHEWLRETRVRHQPESLCLAT